MPILRQSPSEIRVHITRVTNFLYQTFAITVSNHIWQIRLLKYQHASLSHTYSSWWWRSCLPPPGCLCGVWGGTRPCRTEPFQSGKRCIPDLRLEEKDPLKQKYTDEVRNVLLTPTLNHQGEKHSHICLIYQHMLPRGSRAHSVSKLPLSPKCSVSEETDVLNCPPRANLETLMWLFRHNILL